MRRTVALMARHLADAGMGVVIPDLPGMGEHGLSAADTSIADMRRCVSALVTSLAQDGKPVMMAGLRAGCLFDAVPSTSGTWRFAPETGDRLVRTIMRTETSEESDDEHAFVLGQRVSRAFLAELSDAGLADLPKARTVRLATDRAPADLHVDASPLWRHAEPGEDPVLARVLADDLINWTKTCVDF